MNILREQPSALATAFFSASNVDALHSEIVERIGARGYAISRQSDDELGIAMRFVYKTAAVVGAKNVAAEVRRLNDIVLGMAVPSIATSIEHHLRYVRDINTVDILPRGVNGTSTGAEPLIIRR